MNTFAGILEEARKRRAAMAIASAKMRASGTKKFVQSIREVPKDPVFLLNAEQEEKIRELRSQGMSYENLAKAYGVSNFTIINAIRKGA